MIASSIISCFVCQVILPLLLWCTPSRSASILGVFPLNLKSHFIIYDSLMKELVKRGHNVTVISPFPQDEPPAGFHDVDVSECDRMSMDIYDLEEVYKSHDPFYDAPIIGEFVELDRYTLACPPVQRLLASNARFDAVIAEIFSSTTMMAFAEKFNVSSRVWFCPVSVVPWAADIVGNPYNPSYTTYQYSPVVLSPKGSTLYQRIYNTMIYLYSEYIFYATIRHQEETKREYFGFVQPSLADIAKTTSLVLTFSHFSINEPVPLLPQVIEVGGLQIKEAKKLPQDIEKFINESEHGVIYFSFGSLLKIETMPKAKLHAFLAAFSQLRQRVLWKWGDGELPEKTNNIFTAKWMPQRDILAHPKVKLFIAHGGALGINEAVYESVPVLGIPFFGDQTLNLKVLERYGAAEILEYPDIDNQTVFSKLERMLNDQRYSENMKRVSAIFKDRPMSALDTAVFWIEYVIRHKGAPELRSAAADLPLYQYLLLDVIGVCALVLFIFIFLCSRAVRRLTKILFTFGRSNRCDTKKNK